MEAKRVKFEFNKKKSDADGSTSSFFFLDVNKQMSFMIMKYEIFLD